jgi:acyl-CoA thioester hydrolase
MAFEYSIKRRVEFSETDMAGIVHYSNFFRYMEAAEHAFFRSLGFSVVSRDVDTPVGWPRVRAECDYRSPLRFEDEFEVKMLVSEKRSKSLSYQFRFSRADVEEIARGSLTVVCVTHHLGQMKSAVIPAFMAAKIEVAPAHLLA